MSSPAQVPPPRPRPRRSVAGPMVLIILGVVFLLGTMGVLHWEHLGYWFAHYWPLLLILWGVIKLVEYFEAQRTGGRAAGIGVGGAFLLIFLILFGLMATQASRVDWESVRDHINIDEDDDCFFCGRSYSYDDQMAQAFPTDGGSLHVINDRGAVNINISDDNQIHVVVHKRIHAEKQADADKWNADTKPQITVSGQLVTVNANTKGAGDHSVTSDLDIAIPRKAAVSITARRGDISVLGRDGDVDISSQKGQVSTSDIHGKVSLNLQGSSARISQVSSDLAVQGRVNDISLEDIKGAVQLNGEFMENVKLSKIAKSVSFKSSRTDMDLVRLDGDLELDSGDLRASNVVGPLRLVTRSKDIQLNGVSGDVRLQDENGPIEMHVSKMGSIQIDNRSAGVQIFLPEKASFQLDARARNGDIQTDFSSVKVNSGDDVSTATGIVGTGGPRLQVNNEHGDIEIRRGSVVAEVPTPPAPGKMPHTPAPPGPPAVTDN